jgi:micrococcal nuclease
MNRLTQPWILQLLTALLLVTSTANAADAVLSGTVTRVIDGDTIDVQLASGPIRVRLHGVDTPERGQPWGKEASAALSTLVLTKVVDLEPFEQDRYDRLIANVFVAKLDVNAELVRKGHAWAYRAYLTREKIGLCSLEADARTARRGLWSLSRNYAPWDWRKRPKKFVDYSDTTAAECVRSMGGG